MSTEPPSTPFGDAAVACEIAIQNPCRYPAVRARRLRPWLTRVVTDLAPGVGSFTARFVSDREMRRLNRTYRDRDRPTDVLSFPGDFVAPGHLGSAAPAPAGEAHLGDVVVSVPTAARQAAARGHQAEREHRLLLLHGVLHCLGYDHERDDGTMERLERRLRHRYLAAAGQAGT